MAAIVYVIVTATIEKERDDAEIGKVDPRHSRRPRRRDGGRPRRSGTILGRGGARRRKASLQRIPSKNRSGRNGEKVREKGRGNPPFFDRVRGRQRGRMFVSARELLDIEAANVGVDCRIYSQARRIATVAHYRKETIEKTARKIDWYEWEQDHTGNLAALGMLEAILTALRSSR
jgi:hypothetical protein